MTTVLDLTKKFELNLEKAQILNIPKMDTKLAVDCSGSMHNEFRCGWVDKTIDLFIAAAMKFDDNGVLEIGFFNHDYIDTPDATINDAGNYTEKHGIRANGGTRYAPPVRALANSAGAAAVVTNITEKAKGFLGKLFGGLTSSSASAATQSSLTVAKPAYIGMITDGDAADFDEFMNVLNDMDKRNYLQLIAVGANVTMATLNRAAALPNVGVIHIKDPHKVTDDQFYELLCNDELKTWVAGL